MSDCSIISEIWFADVDRLTSSFGLFAFEVFVFTILKKSKFMDRTLLRLLDFMDRLLIATPDR